VVLHFTGLTILSNFCEIQFITYVGLTFCSFAFHIQFTPLIKRENCTGVNFTNVLCEAFMLVDPESVKKIDNLTVFFTLLESASVKAVYRMLMKLSPGVNFINNL